jgi:hypothetical protein
MAWARHGHGMASVNQTRPHCVTQMGKTHSKPLAAWHGMGTAWTRHVCVDRPLRCRQTNGIVTFHIRSTIYIQCLQKRRSELKDGVTPAVWFTNQVQRL